MSKIFGSSSQPAQPSSADCVECAAVAGRENYSSRQNRGGGSGKYIWDDPSYVRSIGLGESEISSKDFGTLQLRQQRELQLLAAVKKQGLDQVNNISDIGKICSAYPRMSAADRQTFWVNLMIATAYFESKWKATTKSRYRGNEFNWGFLQLSSGDSKNYRGSEDCRRITYDSMAANDSININCGAYIMKTILERGPEIGRNKKTHEPIYNRNQKKLFLTKSEGPYWQTLRDEKTQSKIIRMVSQAPPCGSPRTQANPASGKSRKH